MAELVRVEVIADINADELLQGVTSPNTWLAIGQEAEKDMFDYVPATNEEILSSSGSENIESEKGGVSIEYITPYAARMYFNNYNFNQDYHPNATNEWDKHSIAEGGAVHGLFMRNVQKIIEENL